MNRILLALSTLMAFAFAPITADDGITGYWKTMDEISGKAQSIIAIYKYNDRYFGRLILSYNDDGTVSDTIYQPKNRAPGVVGDPYYSDFDLIFNLKKVGDKYTDGSIVDPKKGNKYGAELWVDGGNLIVRGKLLMFGRNQTWPRAVDTDFPHGFEKPELSQFVPVIPKLK